ncbi:MAG: hypothetical protein ACK417_07940 [Bacteroidia bacterium]
MKIKLYLLLLLLALGTQACKTATPPTQAAEVEDTNDNTPPTGRPATLIPSTQTETQ